MTNEITQPNTTAVAVNKGASRGFGASVTTHDYVLPRIELLQALSPAVSEGIGKVGSIVNNITKEDLGKEVTIIPLKLEKNFIRWFPRQEGGGIMYRTSDANDPRVIEDTKWIGKDKPKCTAYLNFLCMVAGQSIPLVASFSMTSYKAGRTLLTLAKSSGGDLFANKYKLTARQRQNNFGVFWVYQVDKIGPCTEDEFKMAETMYNTFENIEMQFEADGATETPTQGAHTEEF